jgi:hypothetical protein
MAGIHRNKNGFVLLLSNEFPSIVPRDLHIPN